MATDPGWPTIEFIQPQPQPWRCGCNPNTIGFRKRLILGMTALLVVCIAVAGIACGLLLSGGLSLIGGLSVGLSGATTAVALWLWTRLEFCGACGACTKRPLMNRRAIWCPGCNNLNDPAQLGIVSAETSVWNAPEFIHYGDPISQFLATCILIAIEDGGREIRFEPEENTYEVRILYGDEFHELNPPPPYIQFAVAQTAKALAGLDPSPCNEVKRGRFHVQARDRVVPVDLTIRPTQFGQNLVFQWSP